jgi:CRP/FNR family transcriptional regulator, cyclic AMP receptor protein
LVLSSDIDGIIAVRRSESIAVRRSEKLMKARTPKAKAASKKPSVVLAAIEENIPTRPFSSSKFLTEAGKGRTVMSCAKDQILFSQGDQATSVFYIQQGRVKLSVVSNSGKEAVIATLVAGDFFGEGCLAAQLVRMATASAMTECTITRLEKRVIVEVLRDEPVFSDLLLTYILKRTTRIEEDLVDQLFNSSEKRLARALLLLANFGKDGTPEAVIGHVNQEVLAEMIGTTRSRVSFFMNKFRKLGFIKYNGTLEVHSSLLNVVLHD